MIGRVGFSSRALNGPSRVLSGLILLAASAIGVAAFLWPFFYPPAQSTTSFNAHGQDAPLVFLLLLVFGLGAVVLNLTLGQMRSQTVAVMGVLAALGASLRLVPGPGGFSALFLMPILAGYVYGPGFGFLLGAFTLAVSALIVGGFGPWLPYQMFATGWIGALAGLWGELGRALGWSRPVPSRKEVIFLAVWGGLLGLVYGAVMNLWFWPFVFQPRQADMYWQPGMALKEVITRYALFYVTTSLWWDAGRAAGNMVLILVVGRPLLRSLYRFRARTHLAILQVEPGEM